MTLSIPGGTALDWDLVSVGGYIVSSVGQPLLSHNVFSAKIQHLLSSSILTSSQNIRTIFNVSMSGVYQNLVYRDRRPQHYLYHTHLHQHCQFKSSPSQNNPKQKRSYHIMPHLQKSSHCDILSNSALSLLSYLFLPTYSYAIRSWILSFVSCACLKYTDEGTNCLQTSFLSVLPCFVFRVCPFSIITTLHSSENSFRRFRLRFSMEPSCVPALVPPFPAPGLAVSAFLNLCQVLLVIFVYHVGFILSSTWLPLVLNYLLLVPLLLLASRGPAPMILVLIDLSSQFSHCCRFSSLLQVFLIVARLWVSWHGRLGLLYMSPPTTSTAFLFLLAFWCLCHAWQSCPMFAHSVWGLRCFCYFICLAPPFFLHLSSNSCVSSLASFVCLPVLLAVSAFVGLFLPFSLHLSCCLFLFPLRCLLAFVGVLSAFVSICLPVGSLCLPLFVSYHWRLYPPLQVLVSFCLLSFVAGLVALSAFVFPSSRSSHLCSSLSFSIFRICLPV